jgi:hypothetical protein
MNRLEILFMAFIGPPAPHDMRPTPVLRVAFFRRDVCRAR